MKVTQEHITDLILRSKKKAFTLFGKVTVVAWQLPNGYTLIANSGCVDPNNYDFNYGKKLCNEQLKHQLWQLEGYVLAAKSGKRRD